MIPVRNYVALFEPKLAGGDPDIVGDGPTDLHLGKPVHQVPVAAWDDSGHALVADLKGGYLRSARDAPGFLGLRRVSEKVIIPGGGWMGDFEDEEAQWTMPVVAWRLDPQGEGWPMFAIDNGNVALDRPDRVWHPAQYPGGHSKIHFKK